MIPISITCDPRPGNPNSLKAFKANSKFPLGYPKGPEWTTHFPGTLIYPKVFFFMSVTDKLYN